MENCININHPDVIKLSSDLGIPNIVTAAKIGVWQDNHNIYDRFPSKEELFTNSVIDIDSNIITQDNNSYYRGQLQPFTIDNDGNLIESNIINKQWYNKGYFFGNYVVVRMEWENKEKILKHIHNVNVKSVISKR